jgi:hypothetical protein
VEKAKKADDKAEANEPTTEALKEGGQRNVPSMRAMPGNWKRGVSRLIQ